MDRQVLSLIVVGGRQANKRYPVRDA